MKISFTKMQGAGNDFIVLDERAGGYALSPEQYRFLAHRQFGIGADQLLSVRPGREGADFEYVIHNADGGEVEQCGNGARCFVRYILDTGWDAKRPMRILTRAGIISPIARDDGLITVEMGAPIFECEKIPFDTAGLNARLLDGMGTRLEQWALPHPTLSPPHQEPAFANIGAVSMGNPHAVQWVESLVDAPVLTQGALIENHPRFPQRVNAGFMHIRARDHIELRVFERGAGETLACGTGACAAVVIGRRWGLLDAQVRVDTKGGRLDIEWTGIHEPVRLSGPAVRVFEGEIHL